MTTDNTVSSAPVPSEPVPPKRGGVGRLIKWIVLGIVALIVIVVAVVWVNLNSIVRRTIETQATNSLDVKTTLGSAAISIFGGSVSLKDLQIASPPDFKAPQMLSLGEAGVNVSLSELRGDPVHVQRVIIDKPHIVIEANGSKLNFQALMDKPSKTPPTVETPPSGPSQPAEPAKEPLKLIIDELSLTGAQVSLRPGQSGIAGLKEEYTLTIPDILMKSIGSGEGNQNGVAMKELVTQVLTTVAAKAAESDQLPEELKKLLNLNVDAVAAKMGQAVNKQIDKAKGELEKKIGGEATEKIEKALGGKDAGKEVEQGLKGLLGDKKKDKKATTQPK